MCVLCCGGVREEMRLCYRNQSREWSMGWDNKVVKKGGYIIQGESISISESKKTDGDYRFGYIPVWHILFYLISFNPGIRTCLALKSKRLELARCNWLYGHVRSMGYSFKWRDQRYIYSTQFYVLCYNLINAIYWHTQYEPRLAPFPNPPTLTTTPKTHVPRSTPAEIAKPAITLFGW